MRLRILANLRVCNESNSSFTTASSSLEVEEVVEGVLVTVVVVVVAVVVVVGGPAPRKAQKRPRSLPYLVRNNMKMTFVSLPCLMCDNVV